MSDRRRHPNHLQLGGWKYRFVGLMSSTPLGLTAYTIRARIRLQKPLDVENACFGSILRCYLLPPRLFSDPGQGVYHEQ